MSKKTTNSNTKSTPRKHACPHCTCKLYPTGKRKERLEAKLAEKKAALVGAKAELDRAKVAEKTFRKGKRFLYYGQLNQLLNLVDNFNVSDADDVWRLQKMLGGEVAVKFSEVLGGEALDQLKKMSALGQEVQKLIKLGDALAKLLGKVIDRKGKEIDDKSDVLVSAVCKADEKYYSIANEQGKGEKTMRKRTGKITPPQRVFEIRDAILCFIRSEIEARRITICPSTNPVIGNRVTYDVYTDKRKTFLRVKISLERLGVRFRTTKCTCSCGLTHHKVDEETWSDRQMMKLVPKFRGQVIEAISSRYGVQAEYIPPFELGHYSPPHIAFSIPYNKE